MYPPSEDRRSSVGSSHRSSYPHDPLSNRPPDSMDRYVASPTGRARSRSPTRPFNYHGHHSSTASSGWAYPHSPVPLQARGPPTSSSSYDIPPTETHHPAYYPSHRSGYIEGHYAARYTGVVQPPSSTIHHYGEAPYQYAWPAMPGAADCPGQRRRRGNLPREATNMMKKWFQEHLKSPYPSEEEKMNFCEMTGLSMNQVG